MVEPDWKLIADSLPHMVWIGEPDGSTSYFNPHGVRYTGVTNPTFETLLATVHPDDTDRLASEWMEVIRTGQPLRGSYRIRGTDDEFRRLIFGSRTVLNDDGSVRMRVVTAIEADAERTRTEVIADVARQTDRNNAEEFQVAVMGQVADGVYTVDGAGKLTYMNQAASRMLGWTEDELCGQCVHDVVHFQRPDGTPIESSDCALYPSTSEGKLVRSVGESFTRKDGSMFPIAFSSVPLRVGLDTDGVVVVFRDISDAGASSNLIRLLIVDTHAMTSEAFQLLLSTQEGVEVVGSAATSADAILEVTRLLPDVVLMSYELPDLDGVATAKAIRLAAPDTSVILTSQNYDEDIVAAGIEAGCAGVLDKNRAWVDLVGAVRAAFYGQTALSPADLQRVLPVLREKGMRARMSFLTDREREVLSYVAEGLPNRAIAEHLGVQPNTIRNHVQRVLYKLNVHSKLEAVVLANAEQQQT